MTVGSRNDLGLACFRIANRIKSCSVTDSVSGTLLALLAYGIVAKYSAYVTTS